MRVSTARMEGGEERIEFLRGSVGIGGFGG
jgi:hypothetical protein